VLTIAAARDAGYYESPEFARDDYYSEDGQAPGRWVAGRPPPSASPARRTGVTWKHCCRATTRMTVLASVAGSGRGTLALI
jgi:hypothetical protein